MKNVVLITGGSGEIGKYIINKYLNEKNIVINIDVNDIIDKLIKNNPDYTYIKTNVTKIEELLKVKDYIKNKYGYISHIISCAGINSKSEINGIEMMDIGDIDKYISLNLNSHIYLTKIMLELIKNNNKQTNNSITYISSINAIRAYGLPVYSAGKSGIYGFMRAIVKELGKKGIRVNTISLGTVPHKDDDLNEEYFVNYMKMIALDEFVMPEDVADVLFHLTNHLKKITGQNIVLDAGQSI